MYKRQLRKLAGSLSKSKTTCIFINQLREKIGVMFGNPETTPGGRALKFFSSVRLDIRRIEAIKKDSELIGNRVRVKVVKNKVAPPFKQAEFDIMYGTGISKEGTVLDMAVDLGICQKSGAWYTYGEERLGQGRDSVKNYLSENPDLLQELTDKVRHAIGLDVKQDTSAEHAQTSSAATSATQGEPRSASTDDAASEKAAAPHKGAAKSKVSIDEILKEARDLPDKLEKE